MKHIFHSAPGKLKLAPNQKLCPKCQGCRSGMQLHLAATAISGKPMFIWEYCDMCGGRGWIHSSR